MLRRLLPLLFFCTTVFAQTSAPVAARNHLGEAKSAYLALHAEDLVDWRPWSAATFAKAKKSGRPIFLSIGYASCHWCHAMQRESFRNAEIAEMLNSYFVPVLVDREEHPEVDAAYVAFLEATNGSAGWPANLLLTPDLQPLTGATYLQPDALSRLLVIASNRWADEREAMIGDGRRLLGQARARTVTPKAGAVTPAALETLARSIGATYDAAHGGFGGAPKFPRPITISFLLRYAARTNDEAAKQQALSTLRAMAAGAIHDQIGGGFHRYTTDAKWRVPHFEKMLHDQALLAIAYTEAWQITADAQYGDVARATLDYALRHLRSADAPAAFYSSQDSDSFVPRGGPELVEGAFYYWTVPELVHILGDEDGRLLARYWGMREAGNLPEALDPSGQQAGSNLPFVADAALLAEHRARIDAARVRLREIRSKRPAPLPDGKVIAGWNGLIISALARAGAAFDEPRYVEAAVTAARFVTTKLWNPKTKTLRRRWADGETALEATAQDYGLLVQGLLDLYESSYDVRWLELAVTLQARQDELFFDAAAGRYATGTKLPDTLRGLIEERDNALPSADSVSASNLLRLSSLAGNATWRARADGLFAAYAGALDGERTALATAIERSLAPPLQVVIAGNPRMDDARALLRAAYSGFAANRFVTVVNGGPAQQRLAAYLPHVKTLAPVEKHAAAYVCTANACQPPITDAAQLARVLAQ